MVDTVHEGYLAWAVIGQNKFMYIKGYVCASVTVKEREVGLSGVRKGKERIFKHALQQKC